MMNHRSLRYVITPTSGTARSARRDRAKGTASAFVVRGIAVPALVLASLGAVAVATNAVGVSGARAAGAHLTASDYRVAAGPRLAVGGDRAARTAVLARSTSVTSCRAARTAKSAKSARTAKSARSAKSAVRVVPSIPWMYTVTSPAAKPGVIASIPWMYVVTRGHPRRHGDSASVRACAAGRARAAATRA